MATRLRRHEAFVRPAINSVILVVVFGLLALPARAWIAHVSGSHATCVQSSGDATSQTCALPSPTTAGDDVIVGLAWKNAAATVAGVAGSTPGTWLLPYSTVCNPTSDCAAVFICHQCTAQSAITTTMSAGTPFVTTVDEYSGVQRIGATGTLTGTSSSPRLTLPAMTAGDWTVCATASLGNAGAPLPSRGILRSANLTGATAGDVAGTMVDNIAPANGSLTCSEATASGPWAAGGVELTAAAAPTYIWPACDTAHPCVVHHIDTVGDGTADGETLENFKFPMVPSSPGNLLILTVMHVSSTSIAVSDNNNGNWQTAVTTTNAADGQESEILYICGATAGTNLITIQLSQPAIHDQPLHFTYDEVSGIAPSACLDATAAANGLQGTVAPGPVTTTVNGDMIFNYGEETYQYPEYDAPIGGVTTDSSSALLMENIVDKYANEVSVQPTAGAYTPTLYVNDASPARNWNSVAAAFKPSAGAGTQPTGVHVTRILHFVGELVNPVTVPFPSGGNAIVITTSNPVIGWDMANLTDNSGDTYNLVPIKDTLTDPQIFSTCFGPGNANENLVISWSGSAINNHNLFYDIAGAATTGGSTGCVGATVNNDIGFQPSSADAPVTGDPVITPSTAGSVIVSTSYEGTGPPSGSLTPGVVFNSIWATGMIDASSWDTGDPYSYVYTTSTSPISFNYSMANSNGVPNGDSVFDGAAIEILPGASTQAALTSIAVTPANPSVATGATQQFAATGTYSDGSTRTITSLASWSSTGTNTATINGSGLATASCAGTTTIAAALSNLTGQTSLTVTGPGVTTTTLSANPGSPSVGQAITLTAAVSSQCGTPTGTVQFVIDGAYYNAPVALTGTGSASATATLTAGTHTISAVYSGSTSFSSSTSNTLSESVGAVATAIVLSVTPTGSLTPGASYTLTATVTPASGTAVPTGNVVFTIGSSKQTVALSAAGVATLTGTAPTTPQTFTVSSAYQGSAQFSASMSNTLSETVAATTTTTALAISPTGGTLSAGAAFTLTATVTPASGNGTTVPSGNVVFTIGGTTQTVALNPSGVATWTGPAPTTPQTLTISAAYQGSTQFAASASAALNETVAAVDTTTTVAVTPAGGSLAAGALYTITATVSPNAGTTAPGGNVVITVGTTTQTVVLNASGVATLAATAPTTPQTLTISAAYQGSTQFTASTSTTLTETIAALGTSTSLSTSTNQITQGTSITLTATVTPASGTTPPTGSVNFYSGPILLGTGALNQGTATLATTALPAGTDSLTASYTGSGSFGASVSSTIMVTVTNALVNTTTTLTASPTQINTGAAVTLAATVAAVSGTIAPTGSVNFYSGSTLIGTSTLTAGVASLVSTALPTGSDPVSASYAGNTSFNPSVSNTVPVTVTSPQVATATSLTIAPAGGTLNAGSPYTVIATVTPASGATSPTGNVIFTIDGTTQTVPLNAGGVAVFSTLAPTAAGTLTISAAYQGSTSFTASQAGPLNETIAGIATTTSISITPNGSVAVGASYTVTATVSAAVGTTIPTGNVVFTIGGVPEAVAINTSGIATYTGIAPAAGGTLTVSVSYPGSAEFLASSSSTLNEIVLLAPTITSLRASQTQINTGASVTLTATVTSASGATVAGGSVGFYNGQTLLGAVPLASGVASLTINTLATGTNPVNAMYTGSGSFASSTSSTITISVTTGSNPTPVITDMSPLLTLAGASGFTLTVTGSGFGSASTVYWGSNALTTQFTGTTQLAAPVPTSGLATPGISSVTVLSPAPGGGASNVFQFEVDSAGPNVTPPHFTPATATVTPGSNAAYSVVLPADATNVSAQCLNLPSGATCTYSASTSVVTIATASTTPAGTYQITVVFTETLPASAAAFALFPILLLPLSSRRRRKSARTLVVKAGTLAILAAGALLASGCGTTVGGTSTSTQTQNGAVTSSAVVTLTVQ